MVFGNVFVSIAPLSRLMFVAHLESWLFSNREKSTESRVLTILLEDNELDTINLHVIQGTFVVSLWQSDKFSIGGIVTGEVNEDAEYTNPQIFHDIKNSPPDSWWLFFDDDTSHSSEIESQWCLVNYEKQKAYIGPTPTTSYFWRDKWEISEWKRFEEV
jgi:hypothetical protein